ncbi:MAG: GNAT family N-acetyltransferase [Pseudomonadota bacterium]
MTANDNKTRRKAKKHPNKLSAHVTHLELSHHHQYNIPVPTRPTIALMRAKNIPGDYYSYLYEIVGKSHHWQDRRNLSEPDLYRIINDDECEVHILYADGCPAGFFELDLSDKPNSVEILYFGLSLNYQGLGIGKWFLSAAISASWAHKPEKVCIETNTLDHPAALQLYQRMGFSPVRVSDVEIIPWD